MFVWGKAPHEISDISYVMDFYFHIRNLLLFLFFVYIIQNKSTVVNINIKNIYIFILSKSIEVHFALWYNEIVGVLQNTPFIDFSVAVVYNNYILI